MLFCCFDNMSQCENHNFHLFKTASSFSAPEAKLLTKIKKTKGKALERKLPAVAKVIPPWLHMLLEEVATAESAAPEGFEAAMAVAVAVAEAPPGGAAHTHRARRGPLKDHCIRLLRAG